jgi:radical SAM protein with 4Fe4S-binding SPASM domain
MGKVFKWDITSACNLRCAHCLTGDKYRKFKINKILPFEHIKKIIDELAQGDVEHINLLGGEPTALRYFYDVISYGTSKGIRMTSNTNGTLLMADNFSKLASSGIAGLTISLDGPTVESNDSIRGKGVFNKVMNNIRALMEYKFKNNLILQVTINTVLTRANFEIMDKMIDLCSELRVDNWSLLQFYIYGYAAESQASLLLSPKEIVETAVKIARILREKKPAFSFVSKFCFHLVKEYIKKYYDLDLGSIENRCQGSLREGFVDPSGTMLPCDRVSQEHYSIKEAYIKIHRKNLVEHHFYEIWNSPDFLDFFKLITKENNYENYEPCNRCKYRIAKICVPCPVAGVNKNKKAIFRECEYVAQFMADISDIGRLPEEYKGHLEKLPRWEIDQVQEGLQNMTNLEKRV